MYLDSNSELDYAATAHLLPLVTTRKVEKRIVFQTLYILILYNHENLYISNFLLHANYYLSYSLFDREKYM